MKLENIETNKILASCRFVNESKGEELFRLYHSYDFEQFDKWNIVADLWGYTELPECLRNIIIFSVKRKCCAPLVISFLEKLRFPNLQCAAMMYIKDFDYFKQLLTIWNESKAKSKSVLWSIFEMWNWRLETTVESQKDKDVWLKEKAVDLIRVFLSFVFKYDCAKVFIKWLFEKGYHEWRRSSISKQLLLLMEANVLYNWNDGMFDSDNLNIDYLTFVACEVYKKNSFGNDIVKIVLENFDKSIENNNIKTTLPIDEKTIKAIEAYAEMYWVINEKEIEAAVEKSIEDKACKFEGWNIRIDYNDVQQESFVLCSLLCLIKNHIIEGEQKRHLFEIVSGHLFRQIHVCNNMWQQYYSLALCMGRIVALDIPSVGIDIYDKKLIEIHNNIENLLTVFNFTNKLKMNEQNKKVLLDRWNYEREAWEGRKSTTSQYVDFEIMEKIIGIL